MNIFESLPVGDSAVWVDAPIILPDGRTADATTWGLTYYLRGPASIDLVALSDGKNWRTTIGAATSATYTAGTYLWSAAVSTNAERITIASGQLTLTPDLSAITTAVDLRSQAARALADCEAAMATFNATGGKVKKYEIAGRSMEFQTIGDLLTLHSFWKAKVTSEQHSQSVANGLGNPRNLYTRFVRP